MPRKKGTKLIANGDKKAEREMTIQAAQEWVERAELQLSPIKIRAATKVGRFVEQEGEHHYARAILSDNYEILVKRRELCEQMLAEAVASGNKEEIANWIKLSLSAINDINTTAKFMSMTRAKTDPDADAAPAKVPTMPARTEITNNTQVVVGVIPKG